MRLTRAPGREAAYLYLTAAGEPRNVARTIEAPVPGPELLLDFDADGYLIGIEFLGPTQQLRPSTLTSATPS